MSSQQNFDARAQRLLRIPAAGKITILTMIEFTSNGIVWLWIIEVSEKEVTFTLLSVLFFVVSVGGIDLGYGGYAERELQ